MLMRLLLSHLVVFWLGCMVGAVGLAVLWVASADDDRERKQATVAHLRSISTRDVS